MAYSKAALRLAKPQVVELPRLDARISFLYVERAKIVQTETGIVSYNEDGSLLQIPSASLAVLLLGTGTSLTTQAAITLYRSGCCIIFTGSSGAMAYCAARPLTDKAKWSEAQARLWASPADRLLAAKNMYKSRYPDMEWDGLDNLNVMRGMEGAKVRNAYKVASRKAGIASWKRQIDNDTDIVNSMLNLANSILYGSALAACSALALNPALGFIHEGSVGALLYDLADNHKAHSSIPISFASAKSDHPALYVRTKMREYIHSENVLTQTLIVLTTILQPYLTEHTGDYLLDDVGHVAGMHNYE